MGNVQSAFWERVDRLWVALASVKITFVVFFGLLLLSIPGTVILQYNISSVDPGVQYQYDFWRFGQIFQLFTSYHSFWYVGLIAILAINLIACSEQRWPQMWRLASAKPVAWARETFLQQASDLRHTWQTQVGKDEALRSVLAAVRSPLAKPVVVEEGPDSFQVFWQTGRWSRIANYLVHTSLLVIFAGAILSSLYGFEGAANIPEGQAVDTFLLFKEGKASGLEPTPEGLLNERLIGFRVEAERFDVKFYPDFPGRPADFVSKLNLYENGELVKSGEIRVNTPMTYKNFTFYQASYGRMGDYKVKLRLLDRRDPLNRQASLEGRLGVAVTAPDTLTLSKDKSPVKLVALQAADNLQGLGPGVLFQEVKDDRPVGEAFWVLQRFPQFDFRRDAPYAVVVDEVREVFFTGLQVGNDPGAPIYWFGCVGLLLGTFYALFVTHKKYHLRYERGQVDFAATIHRLPMGFEKRVARWAQTFQNFLKPTPGSIPAPSGENA